MFQYFIMISLFLSSISQRSRIIDKAIIIRTISHRLLEMKSIIKQKHYRGFSK